VPEKDRTWLESKKEDGGNYGRWSEEGMSEEDLTWYESENKMARI